MLPSNLVLSYIASSSSTRLMHGYYYILNSMTTQLDPSIWRVPQTVDYICQRDFKFVTLQFPDDLLPQSAQITQLVQAECASRGHPIKVTSKERATFLPRQQSHRPVFSSSFLPSFHTGIHPSRYHLQPPQCR